MRRILGAAAAALIAACGGGEDRCRTGDVFREVDCIDAARMKADVDTLASPAFAGRRAGTPGNALAVDLVASRFDASGLATGGAGRRQRFAFEDWTPTAPPALALDGDALALGTEYEVVFDSGSGSVPTAPLVFVGYGLKVPAYDPVASPELAGCPLAESGHDDYAGVDVAGKIVVALIGAPGGDTAGLAQCPRDAELGTSAAWYRLAWYKGLRAAWSGAAGLLLVRPYAQGGEPVPFTSAAGALPILLVDRGRMEAVLPDLAAWAAAIDATYAPSSHPAAATASMAVSGEVRTLEAENVLGVVPGADPALRDEVIVVGAHLDHMGLLPLRTAYFPGADDNASGTALVLELARAVAASPTRPARTILFAAWNAEELGLLGSCFYVEQEPRLPLASTVAAFSVDMVGSGTPGLELWGGEDFPWMAALVERSRLALGLPWSVSSLPALYASDHRCFAIEAGLPGFLVSTPTLHAHPTYHTEGDVAEGVSAANLEAAAKMLWAGLRPLAMGESPW